MLTPPAALAGRPFQTTLPVEVLKTSGPAPTVEEVTSGALDTRFRDFHVRGSHLVKSALWFRLAPPAAEAPGETPVLLVRSGMQMRRAMPVSLRW
ncbi:MAG TPA: hypothetical protein VKQ31_05135 [Steroidobacteraceae bacterium]|nr:hypothetical protein [Steroidobacteraceae bacterium]